MRISIDEGDAGFGEYQAAANRGDKIVVTRNGEQVFGVITADDQEKFAERYALDGNGDQIPDHTDPNRPMIIREGGEVVIEISGAENSMFG